MKMGNLNRTSMCNRYTHLHCMHWNRHEHAHTTRTIAIRILAPSDPFSGVSSVVFCVPYSLTLDIPHWLHLDSHHCEILLILCSSHGRIKCLVWSPIETPLRLVAHILYISIIRLQIDMTKKCARLFTRSGFCVFLYVRHANAMDTISISKTFSSAAHLHMHTWLTRKMKQN